MRKFLIPALLVSAAFGQTTTRTYSFTHIPTVQEFQEIANIMRTMTGIAAVSPDNDQKTVTLTATAEQIGITDWLFQQFDQPPQGQAPVPYAVTKDDVLQLLYLPSTQTVQDFQEIANGVRTLVEIKQATAENAQRAFVIRGTPAQIAQSAWMINDLTQSTHASAPHQYQQAADDVTQIFYLTYTASVSDFQEIAMLVRTIGVIRRAIAENGNKALIVRGTAAQIAMSAWLVNELDQPPPAPAAHEYRVAVDDLVRVFYLPATATKQDVQAAASRIRITAKNQQTSGLYAPKAIIIRGTSSQIAQAEQLLAQ